MALASALGIDVSGVSQPTFSASALLLAMRASNRERELSGALVVTMAIVAPISPALASSIANLSPASIMAAISALPAFSSYTISVTGVTNIAYTPTFAPTTPPAKSSQPAAPFPVGAIAGGVGAALLIAAGFFLARRQLGLADKESLKIHVASLDTSEEGEDDYFDVDGLKKRNKDLKRVLTTYRRFKHLLDVGDEDEDDAEFEALHRIKPRPTQGLEGEGEGEGEEGKDDEDDDVSLTSFEGPARKHATHLLRLRNHARAQIARHAESLALKLQIHDDSDSGGEFEEHKGKERERGPDTDSDMTDDSGESSHDFEEAATTDKRELIKNTEKFDL